MKQPRERRKQLPVSTVFLLGGIGVGVAFLMFSVDWACTTIGMALLGALVAVAIEALFQVVYRRIAKRQNKPSSWGFKQQFVLLIVLIAVFAGWARLSVSGMKSEAFKRAFGTELSSAIINLTVEAHYAGGPGDRICLIRFHADRAAIESLIAHRHLKKNSDQVESYLRGEVNWPDLWNRLAALNAAPFNATWWNVPAMAKPEVYEWSSHDGTGPSQSVKLIWERPPARLM